jgi:hypothetical protein
MSIGFMIPELILIEDRPDTIIRQLTRRRTRIRKVRLNDRNELPGIFLRVKGGCNVRLIPHSNL